MAVSQNIGTMVTAFLPALFATVAPPGSSNVPVVVGSITLLTTVIAAITAYSARETYRLKLEDLGNPNAVPLTKEEYEALRDQVVSAAELFPHVPA
jgi:hypothetical protein